jgi:hypothetical protein
MNKLDHKTSLSPQLVGVTVGILVSLDNLSHAGLDAGELFAGGCVLRGPPARTSFIGLV